MDAQYTHPRLVALYDRLNAGDEEFRFYLGHIGPDPVRMLDVGCGTGLFCHMAAKLGHGVVGLEPAGQMLDVARAGDPEKRVRWIAGDISAIAGEDLFDAVTMTGHAFQCLLTDAEVEAWLRAARRVLKPGGKLLFETRNPAAKAWEGWNREDTCRVMEEQGGAPVTIYHDVQQVEEDMVAFSTTHIFMDEILTSHSRLRFTGQDRLAGWLAHSGFSRVDWFGNWGGGLFTADSREIIVVAT